MIILLLHIIGVQVMNGTNIISHQVGGLLPIALRSWPKWRALQVCYTKHVFARAMDRPSRHIWLIAIISKGLRMTCVAHFLVYVQSSPSFSDKQSTNQQSSGSGSPFHIWSLMFNIYRRKKTDTNTNHNNTCLITQSFIFHIRCFIYLSKSHT